MPSIGRPAIEDLVSTIKGLSNSEAEWRAKVAACPHRNTVWVGHGHATCEDCGALLPDEDPNIESK